MSNFHKFISDLNIHNYTTLEQNSKFSLSYNGDDLEQAYTEDQKNKSYPDSRLVAAMDLYNSVLRSHREITKSPKDYYRRYAPEVEKRVRTNDMVLDSYEEYLKS